MEGASKRVAGRVSSSPLGPRGGRGDNRSIVTIDRQCLRRTNSIAYFDLNYETRSIMARWPRHAWTTLFTYGTIFLGFPLLCLLAYAWVNGWIF